MGAETVKLLDGPSLVFPSGRLCVLPNLSVSEASLPVVASVSAQCANEAAKRKKTNVKSNLEVGLGSCTAEW